MKGYKVFNPDWTCKDMQYEVGKTYEMKETPILCKRGFHFCEKAADCFQYYGFDSDNKVAEIEAYGELKKGGNKHCTNKIKIVRELNWHEVLDIVNTGKHCTGFLNNGDWNSGDENGGDRNSGNGNSGDENSGDRNSGNGNSGDENSGDRNSGDENSGNGNSGNGNSGDWNSGDWNNGDWNSGDENGGDRNSGNGNSGDENSGDRNSGDWNSGDLNSGNGNSGDWNSGNGNSGDWNSGSNCVGCFNTIDKPITFFDKASNMTFEEWRSSDAYWLLNKIKFRPTDWICSDDMTDVEKENHPEHETTGGYLKIRDNSDCCIEWWKGLKDKEKAIIKAIPNFDSEKFYKITGIKVDG